MVAAAIYFYPAISEVLAWRSLDRSLPIASSKWNELGKIPNGLSSEFVKEGFRVVQVGHVSIANGDTWRFSFLSHHNLASSESLSIFKGPLGKFRVRGDYFCCEVLIPETAYMKDSDTFLNFLRTTHSSVDLLEQ